MHRCIQYKYACYQPIWTFISQFKSLSCVGNRTIIQFSKLCESVHIISHIFEIIYFKYNLVISSVSPNNGSTQGGTILTINGQFFCNNAQYPLIVNVGGQTCTVLNVSLTTIQCQTLAAPTSIQSRYQGISNHPRKRIIHFLF